MQCPRCDTEIERTASYCPECGLDIEALKDRMRKEGADDSSGSGRSAAESTSADAGSAGGSTADRSTQSGTQTGSETDQQSTAQSSQQGPNQSGGRTGSKRSKRTQQSGSRASGQSTGGAGATQQSGTPARETQAAGSDFTFPLVTGAVYGAVAFVLNFAAVFGLFVYEMGERETELFIPQLEVHQLAGWVFYGGHNVEITAPVFGENVNYLEQLYSSGVSSTVPKMAFYAVPVVGLLLAGRAVASRATGPRATDADKVKAGATVAIGYAALAVAGAATVFNVDIASLSMGVTQVGGAIKPEMQSAVIYMGLAYPLVAGGLGGYMAD